MDLFDHHQQHLSETEAPLAARLRPQTLDDFIGQDSILGPGRLLRRAIQADQLSSVIFYGPPGTGKTTLAQIIANTTHAHFIALNAVLAGVKEIRAAVETAQERRGYHSQRTILFIDEVHRFNKAQQDALLPWVENGTLVLIGATTENPYFEVNKALVSRSRLFQLRSLTAPDLENVLQRALTDPKRGYGQWSIHLEPEASEHLINVANGDARALLNALELAVETTAPAPDGQIYISLAIAEESIQRRAVLYDKEGDAHFDTISAFIKSVRGSDPDAALYWLARMVYAGEDPRFIFRRMLILASEDIGLADPNAVVVNACANAFDRVGLPEGHYPLAQATIYLATTSKSNSVMGFFDALAMVQNEREGDVPTHLKDSNRDKLAFGHGANYTYPHAYREHWVAQQYLPAEIQGQFFYQPSDQGAEAQIGERLARLREVQWAAIRERGVAQDGLSYSPTDPALERWLQRTNNQMSQQLAMIRDRVFQIAQLPRHAVVLDLSGRSGFLTWEALRQVPEGGVYTWIEPDQDVESLKTQTSFLKEFQRPIIVQAPWPELQPQLAALDPNLAFDCILGRNLLALETDKAAVLTQVMALLRSQGKLICAETVPRSSQRIYQLLASGQVGIALYKRWQMAEEAIYNDPNEQMSWHVEALADMMADAGLQVSTELVRVESELYISAALLERWFKVGAQPRSYADRLLASMSPKQVDTIRDRLTQVLLNQTVPWTNSILFLCGIKDDIT
jgi:putative ATPase